VAALARSTADLVAANDPLPRLLEDIRSALEQQSVTVLVRSGAGWSALAAAGEPVAHSPDDGTSIELATTATEAEHVLVTSGRVPSADDHETLRMIADQITVAIDARALAARVVRADDLADVDALRTALLQAVSHDLRTPLASIKAYVSGLRQSDIAWTPAEMAEAHAAIETECDRLNRLVGNLLDAGRLQAGSLPVDLRPTAIEEPISAAVAPLATDRVALDVPEDLPLARTDPTLLERALANLLANADRHSPAMVPIMVDAQLVDGRIHLRVVDRGPGIPMAQRNAVFQPFQRLHDTSAQGAGLGLAITRGFVNAIGGTLSLDDTPGGGLTATITLPLAEPAIESQMQRVREGVTL
jgi:two-component system sensor histidine kinase KdpD